jgi:hypothetical protein
MPVFQGRGELREQPQRTRSRARRERGSRDLPDGAIERFHAAYRPAADAATR